MTCKSINFSFRDAPQECQRMAQTLLVCWKERRDGVVVVEQTHSLFWWGLCLQSQLCTPPISSMHPSWPRVCSVVYVTLLWQLSQGNVQLSLCQTGHSGVQTVGWSQVCVARREHRALSAANPVSLSYLIGSACADTSVAVTEQCMSHKTLDIFS